MESRQPPAAQGIDSFFGRHLVDGEKYKHRSRIFGGYGWYVHKIWQKTQKRELTNAGGWSKIIANHFIKAMTGIVGLSGCRERARLV